MKKDDCSKSFTAGVTPWLDELEARAAEAEKKLSAAKYFASEDAKERDMWREACDTARRERDAAAADLKAALIDRNAWKVCAGLRLEAHKSISAERDAALARCEELSAALDNAAIALQSESVCHKLAVQASDKSRVELKVARQQVAALQQQAQIDARNAMPPPLFNVPFACYNSPVKIPASEVWEGESREVLKSRLANQKRTIEDYQISTARREEEIRTLRRQVIELDQLLRLNNG